MKPNIRRAALLAGLVVLLGALASSSAWATLTLDDVIRLKVAGVSEETILNVIDSEGAVFHLSVDDIIALKDVGASESFIRTLLDTRDPYPSDEEREDRVYREDQRSGWNDYDEFDLDDYSTVFAYHYYDPFAYYWYPWPGYYVYYSPFWWSHCGFYYAGFWSYDWWDPWSPCVSYCDAHYGYDHWFGPSRTRERVDRSWHRVRSAFPERVGREQATLQRAGLTRPRGLTPQAQRAWAAGTERVRTQTTTTRQGVRPGYRAEVRARARTRAETPATASRPAYRDRQEGQRSGERVVRKDSTEPSRSTGASPRSGRDGAAVGRERSRATPNAPSGRTGSSRPENPRRGQGR